MNLKMILALIFCLAFLFCCDSSIPSGADGTLTINITNFNAANTHKAYAFVMDNSVQVAGKVLTVLGGEISLQLEKSNYDPWVGTGGKLYSLLFFIDMNDNNMSGTGDYQLTNGILTNFYLDGDKILNYTNSNFVFRP